MNQKPILIFYVGDYLLHVLRRTLPEDDSGRFFHHKETIQSIIDRLWDQRDIFSDWHYTHPEQKGSASLKEVLTALTETGYEDLGVQEGMESVIAYE